MSSQFPVLSSQKDRRSNQDVIRTYTAYLRIGPDKADQVRELCHSTTVFDVGTNYIEINYTGRDTNRFVVAELKKIASVVGDAEGEITCSYQNEAGDPSFEFYMIAGGKLYVQKGVVSRAPTKCEC